MKEIKVLCLSLLSLVSFGISAQLNVIEYKLENGLTVILNPDASMNDITGAVAVYTGSKNDPITATGMSHYLEHLLFKGTEELGTFNYSAEKVHLDSINMLYEELAKTRDEKVRKNIQLKINEQALKASKYSMPNEFDKLLKSIGSTGVNATTNRDLTIYFNSFPSHQIQKWLDLYAHRFKKPVFRSFQSELEVVYEEKNRAMDNMERRIFERFNKHFYKGHPYGEKNTLGKVEHLKNPSLSSMYAYFDKYYVANNMALILTGNFQPDEVQPFIKQYFGDLRSAEIEQEEIAKVFPISGRQIKKERVSPVKVGVMGFRTVPRYHPDELALDLASNLLMNGSGTGFLDQAQRDGKLMRAWAYSEFEDEAGSQVIIYVPKLLIQSFNSAEKVVLGALEKLKTGDFTDKELQAVKNELYISYQRSLERPGFRMYFLANLYRNGKTYKDIADYPERLKAISKEEVIRVSNKYLGNDYLVMRSRTGLGGKKKLDKPGFKPLEIKQDQESAYANYFNALPEEEIKPRFIDFEKDVISIELGAGSKAYYVKNPINDIYSLKINFHYGTLVNPNLPVIAKALEQSYPKGQNLKTFKEDIALLGSTYSFEAGSNYFSLNLQGIEENFEEVLAKLNQLIQDPALEESGLNVMKNNFKIERKTEEEQPVVIAKALAQYGLYGEKSPVRNRPGLEKILKMEAEEILAQVDPVRKSALTVHFSGQMKPEDFKREFKSLFKYNSNAESNVPVDLEIIDRNEGEIALIPNKSLVQTSLFFVQKSKAFQPEDYPYADLFNIYFDGGFSGILTQEIREYRSLAYSSTAKYQFSYNPKNSNYFFTYLACQGDKTNEAVSLAYDLIHKIPEKPERMDLVRRNVLLSQNSNFPNFRDLSEMLDEYKIQGFNKDPRDMYSETYKSISFQELMEFYHKNIEKQKSFLGIYGDPRRINLEKLEKIAPVRTIKKSEVISF